MKQGRTTILFLCLLGAAHTASAAGHGGQAGGKAHFGTGAASPAPSGGTARGGGVVVHNTLYRDPRSAPPLDPSRKVTEQDCAKPIDWSRGNLKCK